MVKQLSSQTGVDVLERRPKVHGQTQAPVKHETLPHGAQTAVQASSTGVESAARLLMGVGTSSGVVIGDRPAHIRVRDI